MERRSSLRKPIHHDAVVRLEGGAKWPCVIADYCSEGMFLKYSIGASKAIESDMQSAQGRTLTILFSGRTGKEFAIEAHPAHMMRGASGIRFVRQYPDAILALQEYSDAEGQKTTPQEEVEHIVHECIDAIQQAVEPAMNGLYPILVDEIKAAAVKCSTDQQANETMEIANTIERTQGSIQQRFLNAIRDPLAFTHGGDSQGDVVDRLALIDKNEFEDWLTTRVVITKAETQYRAELLPLKMRLDAIGLADKKHHQSPFGPALIVNAFQTAIANSLSILAVERLVFKAFEKHVMEGLEDLYQTLNQILIDHNILPELDPSKQIRKNPSREQPKQEASQTKQDAQAPVAETVAEAPLSPPPLADVTDEPTFSYGGGRFDPSKSPAQQSVTSTNPPFADVSSADKAAQSPDSEQLAAVKTSEQTAKAAFENVMGMVRSLHAQQAAEVDTSNAPVENYSHDELSEGLRELQLASADEVSALDARLSLLERVLENLKQSGAAGKGIHEDQQVAIDVVDRFFASLKKNPRITTEAKEQLHKLEIPVLKVLLQDEGFFDDNNSSVRAVMNRIAQLGAKGSRLNPASRKRVESLVRQIAQEFEQDTVVFDRALGELDQLVERQNLLYKKNVERVAAAAEGVHRVEQAKLAVARALNARLGERAVPAAVTTLIDEGWQDVLNLTHIKHGESSPEWKSKLAVIDNLMAYADNPDVGLDLKSLVPSIQEGLKSVSGTNDASPKVRETLKQFFAGVPAGKVERVKPELKEVPQSEDDLARKNVAKLKTLKPWILRAKSVAVGSWVQFNKPEEETQYMRLVWIAKGYSKYVFVNHQGMKVVELGLFKFANYLKDSIALPDPGYEMPIVNQGLDDMVKDVYDRLAFESSHDKASGLPNHHEFCRQVREIMKNGEPAAACSLLFIRFEAMLEGVETNLSAKFSKQVAETMAPFCSEVSVLGRVGKRDFALFSVNDEMELLNVRCGEVLMELCEQEENVEARLLVAVGESRAHLGFNNPESMLSHASKPVSEAFVGHKRPIPADSSQEISPDLDNERAEAAEAEAEPPLLTSEVVDIDEQAQELEPEIQSFSDREFEIYCQRSMCLADDSIHEEQYELVCSETGSGVSFEPDDEASKRALDQWWIDTLIASRQSQAPSWDGIDFMRVRLSGYAFLDDGFKDQLIQLADDGKLQAGQIWFDLYDCAVIPNMHAAADMMKHLMIKGYRFCLDQFGTSQSPFPLLKVLPVDMIKIDQSYIELLNEDEADETAADSVVEVAHYLGKEVLASSVDSAICLQRMKKLKVDFVQGSTISEYELLDQAAMDTA